jgi:hypothetical protein
VRQRPAAVAHLVEQLHRPEATGGFLHCPA